MYSSLLHEFETDCRDTDTVGVHWAMKLQGTLWWLLRDSYLSRDVAVAGDLRVMGRLTTRKADHLFRGAPAYDWRSDDQRFIELARRCADRFNAIENIRRIEEWRKPSSRDPFVSLNDIVGNLPSMPHRDPALEPPPGLVPALPPSANHVLSEAESRSGRLMCYMAINLLAIGTPEENAEAIAFLKETTGLGFGTEKEWRDWWGRSYAVAPASSAWRKPRSAPAGD